MQPKIFLSCMLICLCHFSFAQIKWSNDSTSADKIEWNNYSTTYLGDYKNSTPFIVTAIPYNGSYSNFDETNTPLDLSFNGSLFRFKSNLLEKTPEFHTNDSSNVYFLTPFIYPSNADEYEYRVTLNAKTIITPWSKVEKFSDIGLNTFKGGFGYLGGYKTTWGNFIIVELRKKGTDSILSNSIVYWKEIKPVIGSLYTTFNFNEFFKLLKNPSNRTEAKNAIPEKLSLTPDEPNIIFSITADIYKKEALEYSLIKNGETFVSWKPNDFDNNFIWLQNLSYGNYVLQLRFAKQRHNVTQYAFEIKPFWYQTIFSKTIFLFLIIAALASVFMLLRLRKQKRKLIIAQQQREKKETELKSIRAQLNPHFVFNSLSSIQGLINKNEIDSANKYLSDFANLMRTTLTANDKENNNLDIEIKTLNDYLQLEQLRFHFGYNISVSKSINSSAVEIPSLLLQPIIENAVKHGISYLLEKGKIDIVFTQKNSDMLVDIIDNGKGFDVTKNTIGYGLKLTKERIALINGISKTQSIGVNIQSTEGTTVHLVFKNWLG